MLKNKNKEKFNKDFSKQKIHDVTFSQVKERMNTIEYEEETDVNVFTKFKRKVLVLSSGFCLLFAIITCIMAVFICKSINHIFVDGDLENDKIFKEFVKENSFGEYVKCYSVNTNNNSLLYILKSEKDDYFFYLIERSDKDNIEEISFNFNNQEIKKDKNIDFIFDKGVVLSEEGYLYISLISRGKTEKYAVYVK